MKKAPKLKKDIESKLQQAMKSMNLHGVKVTCDQHGCVELTGTVTNYDDGALAFAIALTTPGVAVVTNKLKVP